MRRDRAAHLGRIGRNHVVDGLRGHLLAAQPVALVHGAEEVAAADAGRADPAGIVVKGGIAA